MAEYIEREALLNVISETVLFTVRGGVKTPTQEMRGANKVIDRIKSAPTADVVEVRYGEWLPDYEIFVNEPFDTHADRVQTGWKCSLCGRVECEKEPYCNCGAKMDGRGEGE